MTYSPTTWVNNSAPAISAANLNKIEQGIQDAHLEAVTVEATYADTGVDAYAALQAKATAAAGKVLRIPTGSFKCEGTLVIPANTTIVGYRSRIYDTATHRTLLDCSAGGIEIYGLEIEGAGNTATDANGILVKCVGTDNSPSAPTTVAGPKLINCNLHDAGFYGVLCQYTVGGGVINTEISDIGYAGIMCLSCDNFHVRDSHVHDIEPGSTQAYGIIFTRYVDAASEDDLVPDPRCTNCSVIGCRVENVPLYEGLDTHAGQNILFMGNTITGCKRSIAITASALSGNEDFGPINCTAQANTIVQGKAGNAIMVIGASDGVGSTVEAAQGCVVTGNVIEGGGIAESGINGAIQCRATSGLIVGDNTIRNPAVNGIHFYYDNLNFQCSNNAVQDPHDDVITIPACIAALSSNNTGHIGENSLLRVNGTLGTYVGIRGVYIATDTGCEIGFAHNRITCTAPYSLAANLDITAFPTVLAGFVDLSLTTSVALVESAVTFDKAFTVAPYVTVSHDRGHVGTDAVVGAARSVSTTGFTARISNMDTGAFGANETARLYWHAVGY